MARSKNRRKRSRGASVDFSAPKAPTVSVGGSKKRKKPLKDVPDELPKAIEKGIDINEWGSATVALAGVGMAAGLVGSLGRYAGNTAPGANVYDKLGPDGRLILQGIGIVAGSQLITKVLLKDVEAPFLNFKKKDTAKYVNSIAFGAATYRILTGLDFGNIGIRMSGLFDGNLQMASMGPLAREGYVPMTNTPAQKSALKRAFVPSTIATPATNQQFTTYTPHSQRAFHQIMNN